MSKMYLSGVKGIGPWVEDFEYTAFTTAARQKKLSNGVTVNVKAAFDESGAGALDVRYTDPGQSFSGIVAPDQGRPYAEPTRFRSVLVDLLGGAQYTNSNIIRSVVGSENSGDASETDEGSTYSAVDLKVTPRDVGLIPFTAQTPMSEDFAADSGGKALDYLQRRFRRLIEQREEKGLINGVTASTTTFDGLLQLPGALTEAATSSTLDDSVVEAYTKVYDAIGLTPNVCIISVTQWLSYLQSKSTTGGNYQAGPLSLMNAQRTLGMTIGVSKQCPTDKVLVMASEPFAVYRHSIGMRIDTGVQDLQFGQGLVTVRAKIRSTLVSELDQALCIVTVA